MANDSNISVYRAWQNDWNKFVRDVLKARLDNEQKAIINSVQFNSMTAVASGTSRGKDFVAACASLCFLYLTPKFDAKGNLIENTKVAMTAPTGRQVTNIMVPEIRRLMRNAKVLPGRIVSGDIRTSYEEWFLTGFKADDDNEEAWSGFHAANTMFVVTEASGISERVFSAIEGNLQGNSRLLLVFNPNVPYGYAARAMTSNRFKKFRLNSLNAENVVNKKVTIVGQVDYEWVVDKIQNWCTVIAPSDFNEGEGDFHYELDGISRTYRPNDLFRVKILGIFPKVGEDVLIPLHWIELANSRWIERNQFVVVSELGSKKIGADIAGMGRDSSVLCNRFDDYVEAFLSYQSGGRADHMAIAGRLAQALTANPDNKAFIDTIGEGAGVYSRLIELGYENAISCKFSEGARGLKDETGIYEFTNMRAFLFWAVRDWLNPANKHEACLPQNDKFAEEATSIKWKFQSDGKIFIEPKEDIKKRIKRSPDHFDSLACTFYPHVEKNIDMTSVFY